MQHKRRDKVIEFFDTYGAELYGKPEWSQWFGEEKDLYIYVHRKINVYSS